MISLRFESPARMIVSALMRTRMTLVSLVLIAACLLGQEPRSATEWIRDSDEYFPENVPRDASELPRYVIKQVVDADTGKPIGGATVDVLYGVVERQGISPRANVSKRSTVSDEDGWARLRVDDIRGDEGFVMVQVDAPGYSPWCRAGGFLEDDSKPRLTRSPGLRVELVDCVGRPIPGATIVCAYFRKFPLRTATTDQDGRAIIPSIAGTRVGYGSDDPTLFVEKAGSDLGVKIQSIPTEEGAGSLVLRCPCRPSADGAQPSPSTVSVAKTMVPVVVEGFPDDGLIEVVGEGLEVTGVSSITHRGNQPFEVAVPAEGRCALLFSADMRSKIVEVSENARKAAAASTVREPIRVQWFRPSVIKFRLAAPNGTPIPGRASVTWRFAETNGNLFALDDTPSGGAPRPSVVHEITTGLRGPVWLTAVATDPSLRAVSRRIVLPEDGGNLDLGEIRFARMESTLLRVLNPDGSSASSARVVLRHFGHGRGWLETEGDGTLTDLVWWQFEPLAGMALQIEATGFPIPMIRHLEGPGPWTFAFPRPSIDVSVRDDSGVAVRSFGVYLDAHRIIGEAGHCLIPGVDPGAHRLIIVARGFRPRVQQIQLRQDEQRTVSAVLHPLLEPESAPTSRR